MVVGEVASHLHAVSVFYCDDVTVTHDLSGVCADRKLCAGIVHDHTAIAEDFHLVLATLHRYALLCHTPVNAFVVDNGGKGAIDEVTCHDVVAVAGEFIEAMVEGHVVLIAQQTSVCCRLII